MLLTSHQIGHTQMILSALSSCLCLAIAHASDMHQHAIHFAFGLAHC